MIQARQISKRYGRVQVLREATCRVMPGELTLLCGGNGSGKSTLLHILVGLRRPDGGTVVWNGRELAFGQRGAWRGVRRELGFLPQRLSFPPYARLHQLGRFYSRLRGCGRGAFDDWLERVELADCARSRVGELSGGMRQRLGLALTLFHEPSAIIMDEPENNLDAQWRQRLRLWLGEAAERGRTVLITSQLQEQWRGEARRLTCEAGTIRQVHSEGAEPCHT